MKVPGAPSTVSLGPWELCAAFARAKLSSCSGCPGLHPSPCSLRFLGTSNVLGSLVYYSDRQ